jgi:Cu/Ag efflux pump CusA
MAPAAVAGTQTGLEFLHPLAVTVLGGLVSLVIVQALVLPAFRALAIRRGQRTAPAAPDVPGPPDAARTAAVPG